MQSTIDYIVQNLKKNYLSVIEKIQSHPDYNPQIRLIAISKFQPISKMLELFELGQTVFGENRLQEAREKKPKLPATIDLHFVGALQSNKAKYIPALFSTLHSLCSLQTAKILNKNCQINTTKLKVLIQMNLCDEQQKSGLLTYNELKQFVAEIINLNSLQLLGLMTIPNPKLPAIQIAKIYRQLKNYQEKIAQEFSLQDSFVELSMGMSSDYELAISEGATMIRLGTILFGERQ